MTARPQFIAGALCPSCGETDSLLLDKAKQIISCVGCDFVETSQQRDTNSEPKKDENLIKITNLTP